MIIRYAAAIGAFVLICSAAQAQTAISSSFTLGVYADANQHAAGYSQDTYAQSQAGTLNPYSGSLSITSIDPLHAGKSVTVSSSASASWVDAGHGMVAWRDMGWTHNTVDSSAAKLNGFVIDQPVWSYTFQAVDKGLFSMDYDVRATGDKFGLQGVKILWSGPGGNLDLTDPYNPAASGTFTRNLQAGQTCTIGLYNMGNIFTSPLANTSTGYMDADFNWSVNPVPEPASVAGMGVMLLGVFATALRRGR